jgi:hypothetical protein
MTIRIAIYPDNYTNTYYPERIDASSSRWAALLQEAGHKIKWVDVRRPDILGQLNNCNGFMWRWAHFAGMGRIARRLLPVIENQLGLVVYPDQKTWWHYDDKIAQTYLLTAVGIPIPKTWIWYDQVGAKGWSAHAPYPIVMKLSSGASSTNVILVHNFQDANFWIDRMFRGRLVNLNSKFLWGSSNRLYTALRAIFLGNGLILPDNGIELQSGYVYFQELLGGNKFDTRVTIIGKRAFAFRRFNRQGDFRASGSGRIDWNPDMIDEKFIRLAFQAAQRIGSQSCAVDGLYRNGEPVVVEISYTYASWAVYECPGHWHLKGDPDSGELSWVPGHMWPEEAQIEDFLYRLHGKTNLNAYCLSHP